MEQAQTTRQKSKTASKQSAVNTTTATAQLDASQNAWPNMMEISQKQFSIRNKPRLVADASAVVQTQDLVASVMEDAVKDDAVIADEVEKEIAILSSSVTDGAVVNSAIASPFKRTVTNGGFASQPGYTNTKPSLGLMLRGMSHLYMKKVGDIMKPINFLFEHRAKVSLAAINLLVPLFLTWLVMTKVDMVATKVQAASPTVQVFYWAIFYFASILPWVTSQALASGVVVTVKKALIDVSNVGAVAKK